MARQILRLGAPSRVDTRGPDIRVEWDDLALALDPALVEGGATTFLRYLSLQSVNRSHRLNQRLRLRTAATATGAGDDAGPDLSARFENHWTITIGGHELRRADWSPDRSEPYFWNGGAAFNRAAKRDAFRATIEALADLSAADLVLDDGSRSPVHSVRGAAAAGAPEAAARVRRVTPALRQVRGEAVAGDATAAARLLSRRVHLLRGRAASGPAQARARLAIVSVRTIRGAAAAGAPQARARLAVASVRTIRGAAVAGAPGATLHLVRVLPPALRFAHSLRASAPGDALLTALEIEHPAAAQPVRVINDTRNRRIEGAEYVALRFDAKLADDIGGQVPQAELGIDNVGRELTQWIEATGGGVGATVRVMLVLDIEDPPVEWEVMLDVASMAVDQERVTARLGFDPLLGRAAVALRHDPQTSPGLF